MKNWITLRRNPPYTFQVNFWLKQGINVLKQLTLEFSPTYKNIVNIGTSGRKYDLGKICQHFNFSYARKWYILMGHSIS